VAAELGLTTELIGIILLNPILEIAEGGIASGFHEVFYPYFDRMTSNT
jgi:hypothetical protein